MPQELIIAHSNFLERLFRTSSVVSVLAEVFLRVLHYILLESAFTVLHLIVSSLYLSVMLPSLSMVVLEPNGSNTISRISGLDFFPHLQANSYRSLHLVSHSPILDFWTFVPLPVPPFRTFCILFLFPHFGLSYLVLVPPFRLLIFWMFTSSLALIICDPFDLSHVPPLCFRLSCDVHLLCCFTYVPFCLCPHGP